MSPSPNFQNWQRAAEFILAVDFDALEREVRENGGSATQLIPWVAAIRSGHSAQHSLRLFMRMHGLATPQHVKKTIVVKCTVLREHA